MRLQWRCDLFRCPGRRPGGRVVLAGYAGLPGARTAFRYAGADRGRGVLRRHASPGADGAVEVGHARTAVSAGAGPVRVEGVWQVLCDDPAGWRYRIRDARVTPIADPWEAAGLNRRRFLALGALSGLAACAAPSRPQERAAGGGRGHAGRRCRYAGLDARAGHRRHTQPCGTYDPGPGAGAARVHAGRLAHARQRHGRGLPGHRYGFQRRSYRRDGIGAAPHRRLPRSRTRRNGRAGRGVLPAAACHDVRAEPAPGAGRARARRGARDGRRRDRGRPKARISWKAMLRRLEDASAPACAASSAADALPRQRIGQISRPRRRCMAGSPISARRSSGNATGWASSSASRMGPQALVQRAAAGDHAAVGAVPHGLEPAAVALQPARFRPFMRA